MVMICHCRQIDDQKLTQAFQTLRDIKYGGTIDDVSELEPLLNDFDCGGCSRIFERAVQNFNETGDIGIFKRSRERESLERIQQSGLCSTAVSRGYDAFKIPDLRRAAIDDIAAE